MKFSLGILILSLLTSLVAHAKPMNPRQFEELFDEDHKHFQGFSCDASAPDHTARNSLNAMTNLADLEAAAQNTNLLGRVFPNPFCTLLHRDRSLTSLKDFIAIVNRSCQVATEASGLVQSACQLPVYFEIYWDLVSKVNQGPAASQIVVPADWTTLDLRANLWQLPRTFSSWREKQAQLPSIPFRVLTSEMALTLGLKSAAQWLKSLPGKGDNIEPIAASAMSQLFGKNVGAATLALFRNWDCSAHSTSANLNINSCLLRKDLIQVFLKSTLGELEIPANQAMESVQLYRLYVNDAKAHPTPKAVGIRDKSKAPPQPAQLASIVDIALQYERLSALLESTRNPQVLVNSPEATRLAAQLESLIKSNRAIDIEFEGDLAPYRAIAEITQWLQLLKIVERHQLTYPKLAQRQFNLWSNTFDIEKLRQQLKTDLRTKINIVNSVLSSPIQGGKK